MKGIDISYHNGDYNLAQAKAEGYEFVIIRAGYTGWGDGVTKAKDLQFENNYNKAKALGMPVGAYYFTIATDYQKGVDEANWLYENCLKGKQFDYPIYIDVEDDTGGKRWLRNAGKAKTTDGIIGFCETLENKGYYVGIYANLDWFNNWINQDRVKDYDKWLAAWLKNKPKTYLGDRMWQFGGETNKIRSNKISGQSVDQDYCYYDYPGVIKKAGLNGYTKSNNKEESNSTPEPKKSLEELANEVLAGKWGNGEERKKQLEAHGYNYQAVQNLVNEKLGITKNTNKPQYYVIRSGDTLTKIAKQFGTTVNELVKLNNIPNPNLIFAGNQLRVK